MKFTIQKKDGREGTIEIADGKATISCPGAKDALNESLSLLDIAAACEMVMWFARISEQITDDGFEVIDES